MTAIRLRVAVRFAIGSSSRSRLRGCLTILLVAAWASSALAGAASSASAAADAASSTAAVVAAPIEFHAIRASLDVPAHRIEVRDVVHIGRILPDDVPFRFVLNRHLDVAAVYASVGIGKALYDENAVPFTVQDRFDPKHFWEHPPYAELEGWDLVREIVVPPPPGGWGSEPPRLRVEYAGVIADSLHAPVREYGRSFESTSGRIVDEGAFLSAATFWVPWSGEGLFTYDLRVEGPAEWRMISQGDLLREPTGNVRGARRAVRWRCQHPSEEIYLVAGPYRVKTREHAGISLETWCYANTDTTVSAPYLDAAASAIDRYSALYGPYPFSKFALVENYWQTGLGMPSFTLLGDRVIRLPFIVTTSYPHEILHNWWGNGVYVDREQGNWCEGLTTYGADYAAKEAEGGTAARDYRRDALVGYRDFAAAGGRDFPLVRFRERDSGATEAVGYGKTLMVFHMLRRLVGDDAFHGALRRLYGSHRFRRAGWDDLRTEFEAQTRRNLAAWFDQWVQRAGAPGLALADVAAKSAGERGWIVRGTLVQDLPTFELRVPVIVSGDGKRHEMEIEARLLRTPFEIAVDFAPQTVAADPEFQLFRKLHDAEVAPTLSAVLGATSVRVVVGAEVAGALRDALLAVAHDWAKDSRVVVVEETAGEPIGEFDGGTWYFGDGPAAHAFVARDLPELPEVQGALVAAGRVGGANDRPCALLRPRDAESVAQVARKIPHYSKYSWLAFDGDKNVGKGVWDAGASPLVVRVDGAGGKGGSP